MIVRILGEGQFTVPDGEREALEALDTAVTDAVDRGDEDAFASSLAALIAAVRSAGEAVADDAFAPSDLVVPFSDATLAETKGLLAQADDAPRSDDR
jgi:hypothetical protein